LSRFNQFDALSFDEGVQTKALVKWFNVAKGFGFVAPANGSPDAFLHISVLNRAGFHDMTDGTEILCHIAPGPKGPQVIRIVEVTGGTPARAASPAPAGPLLAGPLLTGPGLAGPVLEMSGTVKWFKPDKGFGFVTPDDFGPDTHGAAPFKDVFVHKSVLRRSNLVQLDPGQRVHMRVQETPKGHEATWLALL
jgi:CspA family cold shock protein